MADLSFVFDPSNIDSKADAASSRIAESSGTWAAAGGLNSSQVSDLASSIAVSQIAVASAALSTTAVSQAAATASALSVTAASAASELDSAIRLSVASAISALSVTAASAASSDAASKVNALSAKVIKSEPGTDSRAIHEIIYTSASSIKYVYSSLAA